MLLLTLQQPAAFSIMQHQQSKGSGPGESLVAWERKAGQMYPKTEGRI